ncbi:MAG TPA: cyanophycinase [Planctomycetaceae bacterium]|nr:cyanophycinase [Planctomycetaceae bacterium]
MQHHKCTCRAMWSGLAVMAMFAVMTTAECRGQAFETSVTGPEKGTLVICGGGTLPEPLRAKVVELAGGEFARVVVISTASQTADLPDVETYVAWWRKQKLAELTILHTRSRNEADREEFVEPLKRATGVWFLGGNQAWLIDTYSGTRTEAEMHKLLERGGVIGGTSAGAAVMSKLMIRRGSSNAELGRGFSFVDGAVIDQHFVRRHRQDRLLKVIEQHPELVGLGIDEGTALIVQGRRLSVLGESEVRICFARTESREPVVESLRVGGEADLSVLTRISAARLQRPSTTLVANATPQVAEGTLVIVGGEDVPAEATERFVAAAGGADATVALVSLDGDETKEADNEFMDELRKAGVKSIQRVQVDSRMQANDPQSLALLKTAGGIWLSGAQPQTFVDSCMGTVAEQICHDLLRRGGVIGGMSAGGLMHGEVLVTDSLVPMKRMLVDGYDRGFGFLPGVAITQSSHRGETPAELTQLQQEHPQVVGLGIEDSTALIVRGHVMEVVGENQVSVLDCNSRHEATPTAVLHAGDRYNFKDHALLAHKARTSLGGE